VQTFRSSDNRPSSRKKGHNEPGDCISGFMASVQFAPPDTDDCDVTISERRFDGGNVDLFQFVVDALCDDAPSLKERLPCLKD
jgi:hypothetical protein